jgi:hypothetical protein
MDLEDCNCWSIAEAVGTVARIGCSICRPVRSGMTPGRKREPQPQAAPA